MKTFTAFALLCAFTLLGATAASAQTERVVLAGGCFWGMQAVFSDLKGVTKTVAGYSGGNALTANYELVSTGTTGHAESVEVTYDPSKISFKQLLDVYFLIAHDPTELNRQGPDSGTQYRSTIFPGTKEQTDIANAYIAQLNQAHIFSAPVVTTIETGREFYPAEAYHQDFAVHNPDNPYIVVNDLPKVKKLRQQFPALVRPNAPFKS
jgi:peptide-methionine (S)-S-oxide reductase